MCWLRMLAADHNVEKVWNSHRKPRPSHCGAPHARRADTWFRKHVPRRIDSAQALDFGDGCGCYFRVGFPALSASLRPLQPFTDPLTPHCLGVAPWARCGLRFSHGQDTERV